MTRTIAELRLPLATPSQNEWGKWKWWQRRDFTGRLMDELRVSAGVLRASRPASRRRVVIKRFSAGKLDRGNLVGGCKPLLDALVRVGLLRDDSEQWVDDVYEQHPAEKGEQRMEISIMEVDDGF